MVLNNRRKKLCFGLLPVLFITFLFSLSVCSGNANAQTVSSNIYSSAIYSKNFDPTKIHYNVGPTSSPMYVFSETNVTGLWDYTQALSFTNPFSNKTGTGFSSSVYFTMHSTTGNFLNMNLKSLMANSVLGFEGIDENKPYCTQTWKATIQDTSTVQFLLESSCPAGSFPDNTNFNQVEAIIDFTPESIFWCANDNSQHQCPGHLGVTLYNIDYYFKVLTTQEESYNQTIISQNNTIINQNNAYYQHEYDAEDNISNQSPSDIPNSESQQTTSLINFIGSFVSALGSVQPSSCELTLPFPEFAGGTKTVNICNGKQYAPSIIAIGGSLLLIGTFIPLAYIVLRLIFNEIRSWTNG